MCAKFRGLTRKKRREEFPGTQFLAFNLNQPVTARTTTIYGKKYLPPHNFANFDRKLSPRTSTAWVNKNGKPAVNFVCFRQVVVAFVFNQNIKSIILVISPANTNKKNGRLRFAEVFFRSRRIGTCPR